MNEENKIFHMPFDESDGSNIAFDYTSNRADAVVNGARFVAGKGGNAISFDGNGTCDVSKDVFSNLNGDFSIIAWVQGRAIDCGSPKQMIWVLNFSGLENYVEVPFDIQPGSWYSLGITRKGTLFNFYIGAQLMKSLNLSGTLVGISICQDYYGSEYGFGLLDDVKMYNVALRHEDLINELSESKQPAYLLDGVDFKEYGVFVSGSDGVVSKPKLKTPASLNWDNYHGESVDLTHKFYEPRDITLSCFIKASSKLDFIRKLNAFQQLFDKQGTNRLMIDVHPIKPLVYEVYCKDAIEVSKEWASDLMVGTFKLKLVEPEPIKRVLKHIKINDATKTCSITLTSRKYLNIYWGDGHVDYDVSGTNVVITHDYENNGDYFPIITGCVEEIKSFETNAIIVWERI